MAAFSLVLANVQDLSRFLRELLNHIRDKIAASFQVSAEFRSVQQNQWEALQRIDLVNRAIRRRYAIQRRLYNVKNQTTYNTLTQITS